MHSYDSRSCLLRVTRIFLSTSMKFIWTTRYSNVRRSQTKVANLSKLLSNKLQNPQIDSSPTIYPFSKQHQMYSNRQSSFASSSSRAKPDIPTGKVNLNQRSPKHLCKSSLSSPNAEHNCSVSDSSVAWCNFRPSPTAAQRASLQSGLPRA